MAVETGNAHDDLPREDFIKTNLASNCAMADQHVRALFMPFAYTTFTPSKSNAELFVCIGIFTLFKAELE